MTEDEEATKLVNELRARELQEGLALNEQWANTLQRWSDRLEERQRSLRTLRYLMYGALGLNVFAAIFNLVSNFIRQQ